MSIFKQEVDTVRSDKNKEKMRMFFNQLVDDGDAWEIIYAHKVDTKTRKFIIVRKTTYIYTSYIVGYRKDDMKLVIIKTDPQFETYEEPIFFSKDTIKKARKSFNNYTIYHQGGMMAGYTYFSLMDLCDEEYLAYIYQTKELDAFEVFFKEFGQKNKQI